jgi:hypothetical protein
MEALPARLRPFVTLALHTGMRRGELQGLRWEDVDLATNTLRIRQDKAGDGRWVTLNSVARAALLTVKRAQKVLSPYVFCSPQGRFLHNFDRQWRPALRAAGVPDFRFHDCRHTFASRLAMAGVDLYTVQRAGGWKTQVMVQRYSHLSPDHMRAAVERLAKPAPDSATGTKTGTDAEDGDAALSSKLAIVNGGGGRTRTSDTGLMRPLLCHLSYAAAPVTEQRIYRLTERESSERRPSAGLLCPELCPRADAPRPEDHPAYRPRPPHAGLPGGVGTPPRIVQLQRSRCVVAPL